MPLIFKSGTMTQTRFCPLGTPKLEVVGLPVNIVDQKVRLMLRSSHSAGTGEHSGSKLPDILHICCQRPAADFTPISQRNFRKKGANEAIHGRGAITLNSS